MKWTQYYVWFTCFVIPVSLATACAGDSNVTRTERSTQFQLTVDGHGEFQGRALYTIYMPGQSQSPKNTVSIYVQQGRDHIAVDLTQEASWPLREQYAFTDMRAQRAESQATVQLNGIEYVSIGGMLTLARADATEIAGRVQLSLVPAVGEGQPLEFAGEFRGAWAFDCQVPLNISEARTNSPGAAEEMAAIVQWRSDSTLQTQFCQELAAQRRTAPAHAH